MQVVTNMQAATIKLFLPSGEATGIRTAEISNWTGKAVAGPRTEIDTLLKRAELDSKSTSPSFASSIVRGGASNGLIDWKNKDGKALRDIES
jgi:hypothetical protein